jgi:hypothetical protein
MINLPIGRLISMLGHLPLVKMTRWARGFFLLPCEGTSSSSISSRLEVRRRLCRSLEFLWIWRSSLFLAFLSWKRRERSFLTRASALLGNLPSLRQDIAGDIIEQIRMLWILILILPHTILYDQDLLTPGCVIGWVQSCDHARYLSAACCFCTQPDGVPSWRLAIRNWASYLTPDTCNFRRQARAQ